MNQAISTLQNTPYTSNMNAPAAQAPAAQPAKFFPPTPDFPEWPGNMAMTGTDFTLISQGSEKTDAQDPFKDKSKPIVFLTPKVLKEVQYIVEKMADKTGECAWMFLGRPLSKNSPHVLLYHYFLAEQDATQAHVSLDMEDVVRYTKYLKEHYPDQWTNGDVSQDLHHGHSHGNLGVFWSSTDTKQQEDPTELGFQNDRRFFLVFNSKKQVHASMILYKPVFHRFDNIPVGIYTGNDMPNPQLSAARKKEIDAQLEALVKKPAVRTYGRAGKGYGHYGGYHDAYGDYGDYGDYGLLDDNTSFIDAVRRRTQHRNPPTIMPKKTSLTDRVKNYLLKKNKDTSETNKPASSDMSTDERFSLAVEHTGNMCIEEFYEIQTQVYTLGEDQLTQVKHFLNGEGFSEQLEAVLSELSDLGLFDIYEKREFLEECTRAAVCSWLYDRDSLHPELSAEIDPDIDTLVTHALTQVQLVINDLAVFMDTIFWDEALLVDDMRDVLFGNYMDGMQDVLFGYTEVGLLEG